MYTLKGIFPEPKKDHKRNFIRENMKQLKFTQGKTSKEPKFTLKSIHPPHLTSQPSKRNELSQVRSSPSNRSGKITLTVGKTSLMNTHKRNEVRLQKGDMAEFLKRKEMRKANSPQTPRQDPMESNESSGYLRDVGCQTIDNLAQKMADGAKVTVLYPSNCEDESKMKASGDMVHHGSPVSAQQTPRRGGDEPLRAEDIMESERQRSRLNAILERKDTRDPYLPPGYQKGVLPKYLRDRKDQGSKEAEGTKSDDMQALCPPGHVTLPDTERKETLRMLRNSFAELVSELNKMPVKTDTLKMRNRKIELEKQLAKLEEGIKVFSRPKVFVKMGE